MLSDLQPDIIHRAFIAADDHHFVRRRIHLGGLLRNLLLRRLACDMLASVWRGRCCNRIAILIYINIRRKSAVKLGAVRMLITYN